MNPDSAVESDETGEERTFHSEANGSLPLSGHLSAVVIDFKKNSRPFPVFSNENGGIDVISRICFDGTMFAISYA
jgi:hypothetical protein